MEDRYRPAERRRPCNACAPLALLNVIKASGWVHHAYIAQAVVTLNTGGTIRFRTACS
jgi:hypothetical protein